MEHVGGGLIDGDRPGAGGGIGLLLTHVELEGLKVIGVVVHKKYPLSFDFFGVHSKSGAVHSAVPPPAQPGFQLQIRPVHGGVPLSAH